MDAVIWGDFTALHLLLAALGAVVLYVAVDRLRKSLGSKPADPHLQRAICHGCGWQGQVSRYAGRCPMCNRPLGDGA